jgi:hypothetical protein
MENYEHFMAIWNIRQPFGISYGHLVQFLVIWYIFSRFGMLYQEKSGSTARHPFKKSECSKKKFHQSIRVGKSSEVEL